MKNSISLLQKVVLKLLGLFTFLAFSVFNLSAQGGNVFPPIGNVGIGTSSPAAKLDVVGNMRLTDEIRFTNGDAMKGLIWGNSAFAGYFSRIDDYNGNLGIYTDDHFYIGGLDISTGIPGEKKFYVNTVTGNVGIGTTNPTAQLELGDIYPAGGKNLQIGDDVFFSDIDQVNTLGLYGIQDANKAGIKLGATGPVIWGGENKIGIGTTNPTAKLDVAGTLKISGDEPGFVATVENTNGGDGDGLLIKLGKTHGAWNNGSYLNITNTAPQILSLGLDEVKNFLVRRGFNGGTAALSPNDLLNLVPTGYLTGGIAYISNAVIASINTGMKLPIKFPDLVIPAGLGLTEERVLFPGLSMPSPVPNVPRIVIPALPFPRVDLVNLAGGPFPNFVPKIPNLPTDGLPAIIKPNFDFSVVNNSLTKENQYITFQDKDGRQTGAIEAQSTQDFRDNTILDNVYVLNVLASFVGVDLLDGVTSGIVNISNLVDAFNKIGVSYTSGHGDYAEWLERFDQNEYITPGDIVAVIGGKITKDLTNVEQLMVVSHKPIILGNTPENGKDYMGNNVALMGQVPVKVMGAVKSGDYIVASKEIKGYGVAIHPEDMKAEDHTLAVGRSWENKSESGPKMVNTVVGVQNGNWQLIVEKLQQQQETLNQKIQELESKINSISKKLNN